MNKSETIEALKSLLELLKKKESAQQELVRAESLLQSAFNSPNNAVETYDTYHLEPYIESKIGAKPQKPTGILNQTLIVSPAKKKAYKNELATYEQLRIQAEREYYNEHAEIRTKIRKDELLETEKKIKGAVAIRDEKKQFLENKESEIRSVDFLTEKYKTLPIVQELLDYFLDDRVDSLREAINLHFEELHRRKLEELSEQQVRLTEEAAESARKAAESAKEAAENASEALDRVEDAIRLAQDAYDRANDVYDEVQSAGNNY